MRLGREGDGGGINVGLEVGGFGDVRKVGDETVGDVDSGSDIGVGDGGDIGFVILVDEVRVVFGFECVLEDLKAYVGVADGAGEEDIVAVLRAGAREGGSSFRKTHDGDGDGKGAADGSGVTAGAEEAKLCLIGVKGGCEGGEPFMAGFFGESEAELIGVGFSAHGVDIRNIGA